MNDLFINLIGRWDAEQLLVMHEFMPQEVCIDCMGMGQDLAVVIDVVAGEVLAVAPTGVTCKTCDGRGFRYAWSRS